MQGSDFDSLRYHRKICIKECQKVSIDKVEFCKGEYSGVFSTSLPAYFISSSGVEDLAYVLQFLLSHHF